MHARCPHCGCQIELRLDEQEIGGTLYCPACETLLEVQSFDPPSVDYDKSLPHGKESAT